MYKNRTSFDQLSLKRAKLYNGLKPLDLRTISYRDEENNMELLNDKIAAMIIDTVCKKYKLRYDDLKLETKDEEIVIPRQICMSLIKDRTTLTLEKIGELFNKNYATVLHAKKNSIPSWLLKPKFKIEYDKIESMVLNKEKFIIRAYKVSA